MNKKIAEIIRVNQAGEYGAKCIYEGQIAALKKFRDPDVEVIKHMYEQELEHLEYFNKELVDRKIRPTIMQPIWHFGSYALGYVSGKLGVKAAMACTEAVEEVIEKHYNDQISYLDKIKKEKDLRDMIIGFCNDEIDHKNIASERLRGGSKEKIFKSIIKKMTSIAIMISKKI
jgi:ubiquinone biosynthesis monooxygenase Coq7